jgi:hypothetical protein
MAMLKILLRHLRNISFFCFIIFSAYLLSCVEAQYDTDFFPVHHAPQGVVHDFASRCTFVIFRREIRSVCLNEDYSRT